MTSLVYPALAANPMLDHASINYGKRKTPSELRNEQLKRVRVDNSDVSQITRVSTLAKSLSVSVKQTGPQPRLVDIYQATKPGDKSRFHLLRDKAKEPSAVHQDVLESCDNSANENIILRDGSVGSINFKSGVPAADNLTNKTFRNVKDLSSSLQPQISRSDIDMHAAIKGLHISTVPSTSIELSSPGKKSDQPLSVGDKQYTADHIPLDLTLKSSLRFVSSKPFHWCHNLTTENQCLGLRHFVQTGVQNDGLTSYGNESEISCIGTSFWQGFHSWVYPQSFFPSSILSALTTAAAARGGPEQEFLASHYRAWEDSFRSLYYMFRNKLCNIFYFCAQQFVVLFVGEHVAGRHKNSCSAYVSRSTRGLRGLFKEQGLDFSMPLCKFEITSATTEELEDLTEFEKQNPGQTRLVDSMATIDNSPQSLLAFDGNRNVHCLFDFLLNYRFLASSLVGADVPALYSPVPFQNATVKTPEMSCKQVQVLGADNYDESNPMHSSYSLEIKGMPLPPWLVSRICSVAEHSQEGWFEASFITDPLTEGLNIVQANVNKSSKPDNRESNSEVLMTELSRSSGFEGSVKQLKFANNRYLAWHDCQPLRNLCH